MALWRRLQLGPHTVMRLMCSYLAITGVLWAVASGAAGSSRIADPTFVTVAVASGFFLRSIVAVASPPLALVNAGVAFATATLFVSDAEASHAAQSE